MEAKVLIVVLRDVVADVHEHGAVERLLVDLFDDKHLIVDVVLKVGVHKVREHLKMSFSISERDDHSHALIWGLFRPPLFHELLASKITCTRHWW